MALENGLAVQELTMVAPPVAFIEFEDGLRLPQLAAVVAGGQDAYGPPDQLRPLMERWNPKAHLEIIHDADHFFFGHLDQVTRLLSGHIG
jgi:alpha/beta superfamily hydrolase